MEKKRKQKQEGKGEGKGREGKRNAKDNLGWEKRDI